ncbi:MAG: helix-turn-helix domain-containing protein [Candidatus Omnitrophota bacterium]
MECSLAIKGIASTKVLQDIENAFLKLTGMEFSFIDLKGKPLLSSKKKDPGLLELVNRACAAVASSKKPNICEHNKSYAAFIPIVIEDKVIGVVLMSPSRGPEAIPGIKKEQVKSAADLLAVLINYIFKHEFDFLVVSESDKQFSRNQEAVLKAVGFIKKNYHDKDISLQKVATEVALSHYYFSHIFKDELKITFIEYLTKIRIEASAKLLKNRNLNVNQIAYAVGYQDPNYFSKVFKRYMKTSPIEYRSSILKKGVEKQIITA